MILEVLLDSVLDTIKMVPFLFVAYLIIEFIEHSKSDNIERALSKGGRFGFVPGAVLGLIPQCGFSAMAANFYASGVVTLGTLMAVFLATSDEAIPIMLAYPERYGSLALLIGAKLVWALLVGCMLDIVLAKAIPEGLRGGWGSTAHSAKEVDCHDHEDEDGILLAALKHTLNIAVYVLAFTFLFGVAVELLGEARIAHMFNSLGFLQPFVASLFGLIPNCASSILLTQLYLSGTITFGSVLAGLCTNAGVGLMVLFKSNKSVKQNLFIAVLLYILGAGFGLVFHLLGV